MLEDEVQILHEKYRKAIQHWMEPWIESLGPSNTLQDERIQLYSNRKYFASNFGCVRSMRRFVEYEIRVEGDLRRTYLRTLAQMDQLSASIREEHNASKSQAGRFEDSFDGPR